MKVISQEIPQPSVTKINLKITYLKVNQNLPGAKELMDRVILWGTYLTLWLIEF